MLWLRTFIPQSLLSTNKMEGKLEILQTYQKSEEIVHVLLIFCAFKDFYCNAVKRKHS